MHDLPNLAPALPEVVLALGALALLMVGAFSRAEATRSVTTLAVVLLVGALALVVLLPVHGVTFSGTFVSDAFSRYMKILVLVGAILAVLMSTAYVRAARFDRFEYPVLIVIAVLGMMIMISANDMISLYLGLELQSLSIYVLAAINRDSLRSTEAGLKYFVLGALSSGMLLYGISFIYGYTGTTVFPEIAARLATESEGQMIFVFGIVFVITGLAFKLSAAPFHMWTPDVYEGAPTPVTAFIAAAPKVAAMALTIRVLVDAFGTSPDVLLAWQQIIVFIAILSMTLGAFAAIGQRNIKRLFAYSAIGHMGYALVGLAAGTPQGVESVIIYVTTYLAMTVGAFACVLAMRRREEGMVEEIDDLAGLGKTQPVMAFVFAMLLFSMAGIPPLAGFFGKFYVFFAAVEANLFALAIIAVLASVVAAYYYLRIIKIMYFDEPVEAFEPMPGELRLVLGLSGAFNILFVLFVAPLVAAAAVAARSLF